MLAAQRILVGVAVIAILAIVALYIALIRGQGGPPTPDVLTVPFVAGYMLLMALLLSASLVFPAAIRPAFRGAAAAGLFVLGVLALFSIGLVVLVVSGLAAASTVLASNGSPRGRAVLSAFAGGVVAVALLMAGFEFSWHYLVCPPAVQMSGTTAALFGDSVSYDCNKGVLTTH